MASYNHTKIEKKWQKEWLSSKLFKARENSKKQKYYQLETFPYPSAAGLHVGHPKGYIAEDIHARFRRMQGLEVMYTMGWDAFGLPTENYALKVGKTPEDIARANIKNFKRQVQMFGLSYDWDREINTSSPEYYRWTQWLFIQLFKKGLAYRAKAKVNWCPKDQTVLANEQVIDGKCERDGELVIQKEMEQWFLKITSYADRLLADVGGLDWPAPTITHQENWIGKSEGALLRFNIKGSKEAIEVFTTRPDTLYGATYLVLAPEHELLKNKKLSIKNEAEVQEYISATSRKTDLMRQEQGHEKTGVELKGVYAINPANKEEIPIWIADYVLGSYGTGAIMAVPAHDQRDFEFAKKFKLPMVMVVCPHYPAPTCPVLDEAYVGAGHLVASESFDGMTSEEAKKKITAFVGGKLKIQYRLRDWSVSRQRYWGVPIPMIHCSECGIVPVPDKDLPVLLPKIKDFRPKGMPPLASSKKFINVKCPQCKGSAKRDPETLDTFVDSSWYYLRYCDPKNKKAFASPKNIKYWMPVDLYVIGAEHTVLHLLYSRFITKFLHDEGYLDFEEPFLKLRHVGLIMGSDGQKMSKSKGNVVNPDEIVEKVGADTVRLYEMFMGPFEDSQPWDPQSILGVRRFLDRVWALVVKYTSKKSKIKSLPEDSLNLQRLVHKTIKKVTEDITDFHFNTAISQLMILSNEFEKSGATKEQFEIFLKLLAPFAPHLTEEIWHRQLSNPIAKSIHLEKWPIFDPKLIQENTFELIVQINGKMRDKFEAPIVISQKEAETLTLARVRVKTALGGKPPKKIIFVPKRLINIVV